MTHRMAKAPLSVVLNVVLTVVLAAAIGLSGCRSDLPATGATPTPAPIPDAYLALSTVPVRGDTADVALIVSPDDATPVASVTAFIDYDTTALHFVREQVTGSAVAAARADRGRVTLAAAHPTGFASPSIAVLRFVVRDPGALPLLFLQLREIRGINGRDQRRDIPVAQRGVRRMEDR